MTGGNHDDPTMGAGRAGRRPVALVLALLLTLLGYGAQAVEAQEDSPAADLAGPLVLTGEQLTVDTQPPIVGVRMRLGEMEAVSGASGRVVFPDSPSRDTLNSSVLQVLDQRVELGEGHRVEFERFYYLNARRPVIATFSSERLIRFGFIDTDDQPVDADRVDDVELRSSVGQVLRIQPAEPVWLQSARVARSSGELESKSIQWNIDDVRVRDSSVVHRAQQRFEPDAGDGTVLVGLLFFAATFTAYDGLFGYRVGEGISLQYPDGLVQFYAFPPDGVLTLRGLPRGEYLVSVIGPGPTLARPVALSRNQDVELKLYSWLDVGAVLLALSVFGFGLLLMGRRRARWLSAQHG